jgi:hypothetical protein
MDPMITKQTKRQRELDERMRKEIERIERGGGYQTTHLELHRDGRRDRGRRDADPKRSASSNIGWSMMRWSKHSDYRLRVLPPTPHTALRRQPEIALVSKLESR